MAEKVIIRSVTIDKHGDYIPLEMMEEYVNTVNGKNKMRYLANHRRDIPPIGYFDNAEISNLNSVYHTLIEPISYKNRTTADWDEDLIIEDAGKPLIFINRNDENLELLRIAIDKNNFTSMQSLGETGKQLKELHAEPIALELNMRKDLFPDPQLVITLAKYAFIFYPLITPLMKKMGEKLAEDLADDLYKACKVKAKNLVKKLSSSVRLVRQDIVPKDKVLNTIFEIPGDPYIELHIKSDDPTKIEKGLTTRNLSRVHQKIENLRRHVDISEIYFKLNDKDKWDFNYLLTKDGKAIGTRSIFKKRDHLVNRINLSPTKAFSIGAE
ncbi:MAG: hypothetical protein EOP34_10140, partial [Rickettsiales bacterium]